MNSYKATQQYLYGLQHRGMKFGLRNIRYLLQCVENPERRFRSIHIAGTNGKGSTAAFLASILMEAGYKTALYTSPHLVRFTERIRIDGHEIPEWKLVSYAKQLRPAVERVRATFFEATTCIAFRYFADEEVDVAIIEAGLGGRLDSTNVLAPMASVITNIGLDHTDILGKTIGAIAREKGGIIKRGVACVTASEDKTALAQLRKIARDRHSTLGLAGQIVTCAIDEESPESVSFQSRSFSVRDVNVGLKGKHQLHNARLAVATLDVLKRDRKFRFLTRRINNATVCRGLEHVVKNTGIRGRLETFGRSPQYVLDVAHNPAGIHTLTEALRLRGSKPFTVVFGVMRDKDYPSMIDALAPAAIRIIAVAPTTERALSARILFKHLRSRNLPGRYGGSVAKGLMLARSFGTAVLITGSHYVVGEALKYLRSKKA